MQATTHKSSTNSTASLAPLVDKVAARAHGAVDTVAGAAASAAKALDKRTGKIRGVQQRYVEDCRGYVRDNPFASLGVALAAGFVISKLLRLR